MSDLKKALQDSLAAGDRLQGDISGIKLHPLNLLNALEDSEQRLREKSAQVSRLGYALERMVAVYNATRGADQRWIDALMVAEDALEGFDE